MNPPPSFHHQAGGGLRLTAYPGYERDVVIIEGHALGAGVAGCLRLDRDSRAWLREWLDHVDEEAGS